MGYIVFYILFLHSFLHDSVFRVQFFSPMFSRKFSLMPRLESGGTPGPNITNKQHSNQQ